MKPIGPKINANTGLGPSDLKANEDRSVVKDRRDPRLLDAARMYEKQFLREMVKAMRTTVMESDFVEHSQGEKIFREQLDDQYVEQWGNTGGVGLADVIYQNIEDRFGSSVKLPPKKSFKLGPMPLAPQNKGDPIAKSTTDGFELKTRSGVQREPVGSPLGEGTLLAHGTYNELERWAKVAHPNGLTSEIQFKGELNPLLKTGMSLDAQSTLGWVQPSTDFKLTIRGYDQSTNVVFEPSKPLLSPD